MKNKRIQLGSVLVVMLLISMAFVPAAINAIPEWLDFDPKNVYLDIFLTPTTPEIHIEVDYFYY